MNVLCDNLHNLQIQLSAISPTASSIQDELRKALSERLRGSNSGLLSPELPAGLLPNIPDAFSRATQGIQKSCELRKRKCSHTSTSRNLFGTIAFISTTEYRSLDIEGTCTEEYKTVLLIRFHPAAWLFKMGLGAGFEIARINSQKGWHYGLSGIRAVPDDSLIFQFCRSGCLEGVRELFKEGKASVHDVDSSGLTPLHVS
jgi:hypothetical protein